MSNTFSFLVCILALLVGILIGEKYRKWKKECETEQGKEKEEESKETGNNKEEKNKKN